MKKYTVTDILWDTDGEKIDLPENVIVNAEDEDEVLDILSDEYGWLILSCTIKEDGGSEK